jgi:DNA-binding XRE family transcriptional regulator
VFGSWVTSVTQTSVTRKLTRLRRVSATGYYPKSNTMPAKPLFSNVQHKLLQEAAIRVWESQFKGQKGGQKKMALSLGVSQQAVSNLLRGTYRPGLRVANEIATLDGRNTLEELIGAYGKGDEEPEPATGHKRPARSSADEGAFANLTTCIRFFAGTRHWSAWTVAAARAGYFGGEDFEPPAWADKLDYLEKLMNQGRKAS